MRNFKLVKLSSRYTAFTYWGGWIMIGILLMVCTAMTWDLATYGFELKNFLVVLLFIGLMVLVFWILRLVSTARIVENRFYFKKYFQPEVVIPISQLRDMKTYEDRKGIGMLLTCDTPQGPEKFILVTSTLLLAFDRQNAKDILEEILAENKGQNHPAQS